MTTKTAAKAGKPIKQMGGARPGAGRTQTTYKISVEAARRLQAIAKHHSSDASDIIEGLINQYYAETLAPALEKNRLSDEANQLLAILTPEPQPISTLAKRLRMSQSTLEALIRQHQDQLISQGAHLHVATHSEVAHAIKLPSKLNRNEHTYYNKISRNLFSLNA